MNEGSPIGKFEQKEPAQERISPTIDDLEKAKQEYDNWMNKMGRDSSNNPNKYHSEIRDAGLKVWRIEAALKKAGVIEMTPEEKLTDALDKLYPNARSRTVIEYEEQKYEIVYFPLATSNSGKTVYEWDHKWRPFKEKEPKKRRSPRK